MDFTLKSAEIGGQLQPQHYTNGQGFKGKDQSPQLSWEHAPGAAKSFAITIYDMDAPTGSGFWHWVVFNIPPNVTELPADAGKTEKHLLPEGAIQSHNDAGKPGYAGAAPPAGPAHRYVITVYVLNKMLELGNNATAAMVGGNLNANSIAKASLLVYGQKSN